MTGHDRFDHERLAQGDLDRLAGRARRAMDWRRSVASLRGEGRAEGVIVVADANGTLVDLSIPTAACADGGGAVAELVVRALEDARRDVASKVSASGRETFGEDSVEAARIEQSWRDDMSRPVVETKPLGDEPTAPPTHARPPHPGGW